MPSVLSKESGIGGHKPRVEMGGGGGGGGVSRTADSHRS